MIHGLMITAKLLGALMIHAGTSVASSSKFRFASHSGGAVIVQGKRMKKAMASKAWAWGLKLGAWNLERGLNALLRATCSIGHEGGAGVDCLGRGGEGLDERVKLGRPGRLLFLHSKDRSSFFASCE